jgi:hypothetical protein
MGGGGALPVCGGSDVNAGTLVGGAKLAGVLEDGGNPPAVLGTGG